MLDSMLDVLGYLFAAAVLGSFALWLIAYFLFEAIRYAIRGPSDQLRSVGHSVLDHEPPTPAVIPVELRAPVPAKREAA